MQTKAEQTHPLALLTGIIGHHLPSDSFPGPGSLQTHWESAHYNSVPLLAAPITWAGGWHCSPGGLTVDNQPGLGWSHLNSGEVRVTCSCSSPGQHKPPRPLPHQGQPPTCKAAQPSCTTHHVFMTIKRPQRSGKRLAEVTSPGTPPPPHWQGRECHSDAGFRWGHKQFQPWFPLGAGCQQRGPSACTDCFIFPPNPHLQNAR